MSKNKLNNTQTALLEGQVKEFIGSAKGKISELKRDISLLEKEKEDSRQELENTQARKNQVLQENEGKYFDLFMLSL
mgnify:CR=1 FL=1